MGTGARDLRGLEQAGAGVGLQGGSAESPTVGRPDCLAWKLLHAHPCSHKPGRWTFPGVRRPIVQGHGQGLHPTVSEM